MAVLALMPLLHTALNLPVQMGTAAITIIPIAAQPFAAHPATPTVDMMAAAMIGKLRFLKFKMMGSNLIIAHKRVIAWSWRSIATKSGKIRWLILSRFGTCHFSLFDVPISLLLK